MKSSISSARGSTASTNSWPLCLLISLVLVVERHDLGSAAAFTGEDPRGFPSVLRPTACTDGVSSGRAVLDRGSTARPPHDGTAPDTGRVRGMDTMSFPPGRIDPSDQVSTKPLALQLDIIPNS